MVKIINEGTASKVRIVKEKYDKFFTLGISCLWVLATLWDLICFHCYWSDYMLELYSCFFFVFMFLHFIFPNKIPSIITKYFGLITNVLGRSIIMVIFSLLFLGGEHLFHNLVTILLFIGGVALLVMELLAPDEEKDNKLNNSNENNVSSGNNEPNQSDSNPPTKLDEDNQHGADNYGPDINHSDANESS
jgi:hypothetical protein